MPVDDGTDCDDGSPCTQLSTCSAGMCGSLAPLLTEDFADNAAMWTLGTHWAIGPTAAENSCLIGQDPATDHSPTNDNGVAGVLLGGCTPDEPHDFYCLTSPAIDTSMAPAEVHLAFCRRSTGLPPRGRSASTMVTIAAHYHAGQRDQRRGPGGLRPARQFSGRRGDGRQAPLSAADGSICLL
jgi:hypothetical protein